MTRPVGTKRAVAIGGGTGLPLVLRCLVDLGYDTTAVVTMADDGGSSGVLRATLGVLPPGDIRNCLVALAGESALAALFQYRFPRGAGLEGHALGNLLIAALADLKGDFVSAIEEAERLLDCRGHVLPSTLTSVVLHATDRSGAPVAGQARIAVSDGPISRVTMEPPAPPAYGPALDAVRDADLVVIGPGSLYTSLIPNLLVAGFAEALAVCRGTVVYACNVANQRGETHGMDAAQHLEALLEYGLEGAIDVMLVHGPDPASRSESDPHIEAVLAGSDQIARIESHGVRVLARDLADPAEPLRHEPARLCTTLGEVV